MAYLIARNGPDAGRRHELRLPLSVIGRHPICTIQVDVSAVGRQHAQIRQEGPDFYVEDLKSRNGTFVNGQRVDGRQRLDNGDLLQVVDTTFTFVLTGNESRGPVYVDDDRVSIIAIDSFEIGSDADIRLVLSASDEAKLYALQEITRSLGQALALDEVLPQVLNSLFKIFVQADRGCIVMRREDGLLAPMWTKVRREDAHDTIRISRTIVSQVMESQEAILSADAASDERFEMSQSIADYRIRSMMCSPLVNSEGQSMGVLQIDTLDQRQRFQREDLEILVSVASQAAAAIHAAQLREQALRQQTIERDLKDSSANKLPETKWFRPTICRHCETQFGNLFADES